MTRTRLDLPTHALPGLSQLLQGDLWTTWAGDGRVFPHPDVRQAVHYLRLKPDDSCRLVVFEDRHSEGDRPPSGFLLKLFSSADRALQSFEKVRTRPGTDGTQYPVFVDAEHAAVGLPFPVDLALPNLRHVFDPDRFRRTLLPLLAEYPAAEWRLKRRSLRTEILAYKPERRAVFGIEFECRSRTGDQRAAGKLHGKLEDPVSAIRHHRKASDIADALADSLGRPVARPVGVSPERGFVATRWLDGAPLSTALSSWQAESAPRPEDSQLREVGATLATLHQLPIELEHRPSPIERSQTLLQLADDLAALVPELDDRVQSLARRLAREAAQWALLPSEPVHGDFHPGQVLLNDAGPALVDFDAAGRGYSIDDIGNFIAYLIEFEAEPLIAPFLDGYRERRESDDLSCLGASVATGLFLRLPAPFRRLDLDWRAETRRLLNEAELALEGNLS